MKCIPHTRPGCWWVVSSIQKRRNSIKWLLQTTNECETRAVFGKFIDSFLKPRNQQNVYKNYLTFINVLLTSFKWMKTSSLVVSLTFESKIPLSYFFNNRVQINTKGFSCSAFLCLQINIIRQEICRNITLITEKTIKMIRSNIFHTMAQEIVFWIDRPTDRLPQSLVAQLLSHFQQVNQWVLFFSLLECLGCSIFTIRLSLVMDRGQVRDS